MDQHHLDGAWMHHALAVGRVSRYIARPNPAVGAVVVRDGEVVATGATQQPGGPHAEVVALREAGEAARGSTLVVTLEPCAHHGRTPPCTDAVRAAGIARVVVGLADPSPAAGGGADVLRGAGIDVTVGVLADLVAEDLRGHVAASSHGRPWVTLKLAQTVDGATTTGDPATPWITGERAREAVHALRARADAVLVGSGTVLADDPRLTVRHVPAPGGQPRAVVWDRRGRTPRAAAVVRDGTIVLTAPGATTSWSRTLAARGAEVVEVGDLRAGMAALVARGVREVLAEPGTTLGGALLDAGLVDEVQLHVAQQRLGDPSPVAAVALPANWDPCEARRLGRDVAWRHRPTHDHHDRKAA